MHCIVRLKLGQEENKESDPRGKGRKNEWRNSPAAIKKCEWEFQTSIFFFHCLTLEGFFVPFFFYRDCASLGIKKRENQQKKPGFKFRSLRKTHCRWLKTSSVWSQGTPLPYPLLTSPLHTATVPFSTPPSPPSEQLCNTETVLKRPEHVCSPWQSPESEVDGRNFPEITVSISRLQTSQRRWWWYGSGGKVVSEECFCCKLLCYSC